MAKISQFSRILHHRSTIAGQKFTVPISNDHTDDTWLNTDLYIGEIGINVSDDTIYFRSNNGIIQINTGTSSGGSTSSTALIWNWSSPNIVIGSTYSADSVSPRSGYYTDLGTSTLRWKDLYLGGAVSGQCGINVNAGLDLTEAGSNGILTSGFQVNDNAPLKIYATISNATAMDRPLGLNARDSYFQGTGNQRVIAGFQGVILSGTNNNILVGGGSNVTVDSGVSQHVHLGPGFNRTNYNSNSVVAGNLDVRGIADDGSYQYIKSDWSTRQFSLRTSNALSTNIATASWTDDGTVVQMKGYLMGIDIGNATNVYSAEILATVYGGSSYTATIVGTPIVNAVSSWSGTQPDCEVAVDSNGWYVKVTGKGSTTIQWLLTLSYHKMINMIP